MSTSIPGGVFEDLRLTQAYCQLQLENTQKNHAAIFRSIDPHAIFKFKVSPVADTFMFETHWLRNPVKDPGLIDTLFDVQMEHKRKMVQAKKGTYEGDILVCWLDDTVADGLTGADTKGLLDVYDYPPVDTWFYLTERRLYAWIPAPFEKDILLGIACNPRCCVKWLRHWNMEEYKLLMNGKK